MKICYLIIIIFYTTSFAQTQLSDIDFTNKILSENNEEFETFESVERIELLSLEAEEVTTGDIISFKVLSKYDYEYLSKYKNKRIGDILYLIEVTSEGDSIFFRAIIAEKEKKKNTTKESEKSPTTKNIDKFIIKNLNYKPTQTKKMTDFIVYEGPKINIDEKVVKYGKVIIVVLLSLISIFLGITFYRMRKKRKLVKEKKLKVLNKLLESKTTGDLEKLYLNRNEILENLHLDKELWDEFLIEMNKAQYKKNWSMAENSKLDEILEKLKETARVKDGI